MNKKILHLSVTAEYFNQIKSGEKIEEYRLTSDYWRKRLVNRQYDEIHVKLGYPKKDDYDKIIVKPWNGYQQKTIVHKHFGQSPVDVYAIQLGNN